MRRVATWVMLCLMTVGVAAQQPERATVRFGEQLAQLAPSEPLRYLRLAEEIADVARTAEELSLVRRLYVLALHHALARPEADARAGFPIAASACLGLADIERSEERRRWLRALAGRIDERHAPTRWESTTDAGDGDGAPLLLAEAMGLMLSGDGSLARERLDDPRVQALAERTRDAIDRPGSDASMTRISQEAGVWPCPECGNARAVPDRSQGGRTRRLCSTCRGNPGPLTDHETLVAYLAYQSLLLRGTQRSWSAELEVRGAKPLLDPEPDEVAPAFGIDPEAAYYRRGRWTRDPSALESDASGG